MNGERKIVFEAGIEDQPSDMLPTLEMWVHWGEFPKPGGLTRDARRRLKHVDNAEFWTASDRSTRKVQVWPTRTVTLVEAQRARHLEVRNGKLIYSAGGCEVDVPRYISTEPGAEYMTVVLMNLLVNAQLNGYTDRAHLARYQSLDGSRFIWQLYQERLEAAHKAEPRDVSFSIRMGGLALMTHSSARRLQEMLCRK